MRRKVDGKSEEQGFLHSRLPSFTREEEEMIRCTQPTIPHLTLTLPKINVQPILAPWVNIF